MFTKTFNKKKIATSNRKHRISKRTENKIEIEDITKLTETTIMVSATITTTNRMKRKKHIINNDIMESKRTIAIATTTLTQTIIKIVVITTTSIRKRQIQVGNNKTQRRLCISPRYNTNKKKQRNVKIAIRHLSILHRRIDIKKYEIMLLIV